MKPEEAVDRINAAFGHPADHRVLHAKGSFYSGTFTATADAAALSRAGHLQGEPVPVVVRWSNASGHPRSSDKAPDVRGMAVKFRLPDGSTSDLLGQTAPRFPVRDPRQFVEFTEASRSPVRLALWSARHPHALPSLLANARARAILPPSSFAEKSYYPIHAYGWVDAAGNRTWVRYRFVPHAESGQRPTGTFDGPHRLRSEMAARLDLGPVRYDVLVTVAAEDDDPHDPMSVWRGARELTAGTIEVTSESVDPETEGDAVVFDPTRVVDGIELSDDPILRFRPDAYAVSVSRRSRPR